mgnify:CR=1 FL=1
MIDCENEVYTKIATMLRSDFPGINVASEYVNSPSAFPHVSIVMAENSIMFSRMDSGDHEVAIAVFEINIYSNKTSGKKTECKKIAKAIDNLLLPMNFRRMSMIPVPNMEDATIYRIVARYRVATDGKFFYRR